MEGRSFREKSHLRRQNKLAKGGNGEPLFWMHKDSWRHWGGGCAESLSGLSCV